MIYYPLLFVLGLAIGSFLNVISFRYRPGHPLLEERTIGGRSHCRHCGKELNWYELIPVLSFILQMGKCRNCREKISFQYPIVEITSGLIVAIVPWYLKGLQFSIFGTQAALVAGHWPLIVASAVWIAIFLLFLLLSIIDFRHYLIPDAINLALVILGLVWTFTVSHYGSINYSSGSFLEYYSSIFGLSGNIWASHIIAAMLGMAFFGAIIILSRGAAMGWGDFKLVGAIGLIFGWPDILLVLMVAFIIGALITLPLLIKKKKRLKDAVPFGPFLVLGGTLVFFFGFQIIDYYFKLFGLY